MGFKAKINIIGVNPYVLLPQSILNKLFKLAGKDKGPIPVKGKINDHHFIQTLVKYSGKWRLYLNMGMRKGASADVGDTVTIEIEFDKTERTIAMHPKLEAALNKNKKTKHSFQQLSPSRQREIIWYINFLKTEESVERNIKRAVQFLAGKERFVGRDKP